jgi:hypothetical protein
MPKMQVNERASLNAVAVLASFLRMEVDSLTLPSGLCRRLVRDIENLPQRYQAVLEADEAARVKARQRKATK